MITCCKDCYPCCKFCIYSIKEIFEDKEFINGCSKHPEEHYQSMARGLGYCKDFHCSKLWEVNNGT